ncbi:Variable outer membrane protein (plasmid) [Borrelia hermsii YBT]|uniref:Variable outer membrane protein n=1 Tax=Borrelia hermsii YBT TaxID=1313295 RepID=W5T232_BORHE|nr:hypothetical protein [Borrelia hermsii]AHH13330.1 Variable outer membrane protein [Borrelia hermsii YBT]
MVKESGDAAKLAKETTGNAATLKDATSSRRYSIKSYGKGRKVLKILSMLTIAIRTTVDLGLNNIKRYWLEIN